MNYALIRDPLGNARVDQVLRDDGVFVLTGLLPLGEVPYVVPNFADKDGLAYQAWLAGGNEPGALINPPAPPPQIISRRQFFQQLAITPTSNDPTKTIISQAEALAAVCTGAIPAAMQPLIASLPADAQFAAKMKIAGATQFDRNDTVTAAIAQGYGWSDTQLTAFWLAASLL